MPRWLSEDAQQVRGEFLEEVRRLISALEGLIGKQSAWLLQVFRDVSEIGIARNSAPAF